MKRHEKSTIVAQAGQRAARDNVAIVPYLYSSPNWMLFTAGKALGAMSEVTAAKVSRGYSVKLQTAANDFLVTFDKNDLNKLTVSRA